MGWFCLLGMHALCCLCVPLRFLPVAMQIEGRPCSYCGEVFVALCASQCREVESWALEHGVKGRALH